MDTYFDVNHSKCVRCYKCINLCTDTYKQYGFLGHLMIDEYDGTPDYYGDNCSCHHCDAVIDGEERKYACRDICEHNAIKITRW